MGTPVLSERAKPAGCDALHPARPLTSHHKRCSYGECKDCGWSARMADVDIQDEIQLSNDDESGGELQGL